MDYTTFVLPKREGQWLQEQQIMSLYQTFEQLRDPRRKQGQRYSLAVILSLLVLAKLAGEQSLSGATQWVRHRGEELAQRFGLGRTRMPCQTTYCNVLARVESQPFDELLSAFFVRWEAQSRCGDEPSRLQTPQGQAEHSHLAIDGKTLRATCTQAEPIHQLSCYEVATGIVHWHCNVQQKDNEISALRSRLQAHQITGRIFTMDAMHTQRITCQQIHWNAGFYILIAKDNHPILREDIADLFEDPQPDRRRWQQAETWDKGHGRLEHRTIICSPDLNDWFGKQWAGLAQVFRLERTSQIRASGKLRREVVYGLSNLSMQQAPPERLLALIRAHWSIENRLHWRRDVTLGEDSCQTRTGPVPGVLAQLNSTVLCLMDRLGVRNVARQMRYFNAHPQQALDLILTGRCSVF